MCQHRSQWTSTQQMHMNMIDFLAAMAITVHDQTVSVFSNPFLLCDFRGHRKHTAQRHFMLGFNVIDGRDQNIGNNKDVRRRLGRQYPTEFLGG